MSSFLVTGGAGFIGSHLVEELIALGHSVRVFDNLSTGRLANLRKVDAQFALTVADAADVKKCEEAMVGIEGVFHLAAIPSVHLSIEAPSNTQQSAEVATLALLDAARRARVKRFIFSSSCAVYGDSHPKPIREDSPTKPLTFYGLGKATGEEYCRISSYLDPEFETASLRYFNVFGARQDPSSPYSGVVSIFLRCLREGKQPTIYGDGRQTRDFIDVSNVVAANIALMTSDKQMTGDVFNVGTGISISILDLWKFLARVAECDLKPHFGAARDGDIRHSCADVSKIKEALGWSLKTSTQEGLISLYEMMRESES